MTRWPVIMSIVLLAACSTKPDAVRDGGLAPSRPGATAGQPNAKASAVAKNRKKTTTPAKNSVPSEKQVLLNLYVCNQSFTITPVDIRVFIDGKLLVDGLFPVKYQQNWKKFPLVLSQGVHSFHVESTSGKVEMDHKIDLQETQWGVINFWYQPKEESIAAATSRKFTFEIRGEPFYFDN